jgi:hypothetical protein
MAHWIKDFLHHIGLPGGCALLALGALAFILFFLWLYFSAPKWFK